MSGLCTWTEKCTMCDGMCKIKVWDKKTKKVSYEVCPTCEGTGKILIRRNILRRKA